MLSVDRPSTECRPITHRYIGQVSTNYRRSVGEVSKKCRRNVGEMSTKCWRKVGEVSVNEKLYRLRHIWNDYRPCLDRMSTHYRPTINRYNYRPTIDRVSNECRPSIDRLSTDCRPTIDRVSTDYRPSVDHYIDRYLGRHYPQKTRSQIPIKAREIIRIWTKRK